MKKNRTATYAIILLAISMLINVFTMLKMEFFHLDKIGEIILEVLLVVAGVFVTSFLHIVTHEFGHYVGGRLGGFELVSFHIGFFCIKRRNGKNFVTFERLKNFGGLCQMLPKSKKDVLTSFKRYVSGGLFGSIVATVVFAFISFSPYIFAINQYVYLLFASGFPISLYLLITNLSTESAQGAMTDGGYLKALRENTPLGQATIKITLLQTAFAGGVRPKDVDKALTENYPVFADNDLMGLVIWSNMFSVYLDREDFDNLKKTTEKLERLLQYAPDIYYYPVLSDVFFAKLLFDEKDEAKTLYEELKEYLKKEDDMSALRILAKFHCKMGDKDKAKELAKRAMAKKNTYPLAGIATMEEDLLNTILQEAEK